jgi:hypothetical protein
MKSVRTQRERILLTVFWTFFVLTVALPAYALATDIAWGYFPAGIYRPEAEIASALASRTVCGLFVMSLLFARKNRVILRIGLAGCAWWLVLLSIPRF